MARSLSTRIDCPVAEARQIIDALVECMTEHLEIHHEPIVFAGFGSFSRQWAPPRKFTSWQSGEERMTAGRFYVKFRPSPALNERINESLSRSTTR